MFFANIINIHFNFLKCFHILRQCCSKNISFQRKNIYTCSNDTSFWTGMSGTLHCCRDPVVSTVAIQIIIPYIIYYISNKSDVLTKLVPQGNITVVHRSTNVMFHVCAEMYPFFAFRNYNLDRKLKTQIWSLWKHKIKTHK